MSDPDSLTSPLSSGSSGERNSTFDLLGDRRRRAVLEFLADQDRDAAVSLSDLADHVTLAERDEKTGTLAGCGDVLLGTRRRVRISLRHHHVPKLAAADAVEFDHETNTVSLRETGADLLGRTRAIERATATDACKPKAQ